MAGKQEKCNQRRILAPLNGSEGGRMNKLTVKIR
jgi:hypothetical protein